MKYAIGVPSTVNISTPQISEAKNGMIRIGIRPSSNLAMNIFFHGIDDYPTKNAPTNRLRNRP